MPYVERSIVLAGDKRRAYELAKDFESYPEFCSNVKSVKILRSGEDFTETAWEASVVGRTIRWTERDQLDDAGCRIRYSQTGGDLKKFEGEWRFEDVPEGLRITLTVDFDLGIPMLASLLNPVLIKAVELNADAMLQGIKRRVEASDGG